MDEIRILQVAAAGGDSMALAELALMARRAPEIKRTAGVEYRTIPAAITLKATGRRIIGYGSTFEPPDRHDSYGDIIRAGAFAASLARHKINGTKITMHTQHLDVVGFWDVVEEDLDATNGKIGLYVEGEPLDTSTGNDMLALIQGGVQGHLSIGFFNTVARFLDGFEGRPLHLTPWGYPVREIVELDLLEISVVARAANPYAEILEVRRARKEVKHAPTATAHEDILRRVQLTVASDIARYAHACA